METLLFDGYRAFQKEYNKFEIRKLLRLPWLARILILLTIVAALAPFVLLFANASGLARLMSICVEGVIGVVLYYYSEVYQVKTVDTRLEAYQSYCEDVCDWLKSTGFNANQHSIAELKVRIEKQVTQNENMRVKRHNTVKHIFDVICVPFLVAIFTNAIQEEKDIAMLFTYAFELFSVVLSIGMPVYLLYKLLSFYNKHKFEQLRCFASDLQGILDTQFEEKLISLPLDKRQ